MSIGKKIKKKACEIFKTIEDNDPFGVTIDDYDSGDACTEESKDIPPGDDGYGD